MTDKDTGKNSRAQNKEVASTVHALFDLASNLTNCYFGSLDELANKIEYYESGRMTEQSYLRAWHSLDQRNRAFSEVLRLFLEMGWAGIQEACYRDYEVWQARKQETSKPDPNHGDPI